ncbi:hypothetical protein BN59_00074 [Legionella massiliensis]|uniref:Uncharacterized protein n=1 Tax=Legionella massiliensis TaxID=1034943 RepID=A0A078KN81_9GAMM|nr:hypothetical protein [Legionella massiliensis]CDZ75815.1 hypothetical protein BN59_00074 [Legionella massiliensis]CEE11553.1 hypothetical protein BN1094_00074 [Legionella massiliensis]
MPRSSLDIKTYVQRLLGDNLEPVSRKDQQLAYGYPTERKVYEDPIVEGKQVVVVTEGVQSVGQPNAIHEANNYIDNLAAAAKALIDKDNPKDKELRKKAIDNLAENFKKTIQDNIDPRKATGNLFKSKKQTVNKDFLDELDTAQEILSDYTQALGKLTGHKLKELDEAGHQLRSQNRATLIHRFQAPNAKEGEEQFIMYIPCGRYTKRQQTLMGKGESPNRDHDTTSHNRANLVLGNSSMARMVAGTRHADGTVTILHDSFTGPGARMPYSDFKSADSYKKLAIKAVTLINQEEIIQTLAQRQIDRMSNDELREKIPVEHLPARLPEDEKEARKTLIELYLASPDYQLSVTECYTQVVTAGQKVAAENQHEQFQYVREVMDAFDGTKVKVTIQTGEDSEAEAKVNYQARMGSWGVNWFRGKHNPLADNSITQEQNARFINQMTRDVLENLKQVKGELQDFDRIDALYRLLNNSKTREDEKAIAQLENGHLIPLRSLYRKALFEYFNEYSKGEENWNRDELDRLKGQVELYEGQIKIQERRIYRIHKRIDDRRKSDFLDNRDEILRVLGDLKQQIEPALTSEETSPELKAKLQHFYNTCAYLTHAQELYYKDTWYKDKNNFNLQALMASLAEELDYANTKGCKSNNDRGQRLAQKIVGNALWTKMSDSGLYTRQFLDRKRTHREEVSPIEALDRKLTTIQALHHTANTGVSGGKFEIDKAYFADNGLYGKVANLAKVKDMQPKNAITQNLDLKLGIGAALGLAAGAAVLALCLFPPVGLALATTALGIAGVTALAAVVTFLTILLLTAGVGVIQNIRHDKQIQASADKGLEMAESTLANAHSSNNDRLHQLLGVDHVGSDAHPDNEHRKIVSKDQTEHGVSLGYSDGDEDQAHKGISLSQS